MGGVSSGTVSKEDGEQRSDLSDSPADHVLDAVPCAPSTPRYSLPMMPWYPQHSP